MLLFFAALTSLLTWHLIITPTMEHVRYSRYRSYKLQERTHKLRVVRAFYPEVTHLSLDEIESQYGLDAIYDRVGQRR